MDKRRYEKVETKKESRRTQPEEEEEKNILVCLYLHAFPVDVE